MIPQIKEALPLDELNSDFIKDIQNSLSVLGYYPYDKIDGITGPLTEAGLKEFKKDKWLQFPTIVGNSTINKLNESVKKCSLPKPFNTNNKKEVIHAIIKEGNNQGMTKPQIAYTLATVEHETNNTFKPVIEAYWLSEEWRKNNLRYYPFFGRGFVQITWYENYLKYEKILDLQLTKNPSLVLKSNVSLFILIHGMIHGTFTGLSINDFINSQKTDFYNARKVINGLDKAKRIKILASIYLKSNYFS